MTQRQVVIWEPALKQLQTIQAGDSYLLDENTAITGTLDATGLINGRNPVQDGTKLDLLTVSLPIDLDILDINLIVVQAVTDFISVTGNINLDSVKAKTDQITVTQPVDLDTMEARVASLDASVVLMGTWDASLGTFPVSSYAGESWINTVEGTIDSQLFRKDDRIIALVDGASTIVYLANWLNQTYKGEVISVAGKKGIVVLTETDISDLQTYLLPTDINSIGKLDNIVGESLLIAEDIDSITKLNALMADLGVDLGNFLLPDGSNFLLPDGISQLMFATTSILIDNSDIRLSDTRVPKWQINGGLTAYATGGQANATELVASKCNVCTTCATLYDSFKCPTAVAEQVVMFTNRGATACHLYPNVSDAIEANGPNNPILVNPYATLTLLAIDTTNWIQI